MRIELDLHDYIVYRGARLDMKTHNLYNSMASGDRDMLEILECAYWDALGEERDAKLGKILPDGE